MTGIIILNVILLILLYLLTVLIVIPRMTERRLETYQNRLINRQYEEIRSSYKEMRAFRHDYRNHMQALKVYVENGELEKCRDYILQMDQDLHDVDQMVRSGNAMADAIINSKLSLAREKNIRLNTTLKIPEKLPLSDTEFCAVFGNLMDNAIEACEKIADREKRFIRIYIGVFKKQFYISVTNATAGTKRVTAYLTGKGGEHGFGLYRIDAIVRKHGGYLNRKNEPGVFATEVLLPFVI